MNTYGIELHQVYDRPGRHAMYGIFVGEAAQARAWVRFYRWFLGEPGIQQRFLRAVATPQEEAWLTEQQEDGFIHVEKLQAMGLL